VSRLWWSSISDRFGEVRPFLNAIATDVAHRQAEPVDGFQGVDGIEEVEQIVGIGHVGAALYPVETVLDQRSLYLIISAVVRITVVLFQLGNILVETQCIHKLRKRA